MKVRHITLFCTLFLLSSPAFCSQTDSCFVPSVLEKRVETLCGPSLQGRGRGTLGHSAAALAIYNSFSAAGLVPYDESFIMNFRFGPGNGCMGWNIAGLMPAAGSCFTEIDAADEGIDAPPIVSLPENSPFIVVGAHYDNPGVIDGRSFPGADFNASGVAALVAVIENLRERFPEGLPFNILFVAFDAYSDGCLGSAEFVKSVAEGSLPYPALKDVLLYVELEQLGSAVSLKDCGSDFLFTLGTDRLSPFWRMEMNSCDNRNLRMIPRYYGSVRLTDMLLRMGDRKSFTDKGIPAVLFTSGITSNTNKTGDLPSTLDYSLLSRRAALIADLVALFAGNGNNPGQAFQNSLL